jgi:hypothetical protein
MLILKAADSSAVYELSWGTRRKLQQDAAATVTPDTKLSVSKCQAHMGAPTPSWAALGLAFGGGSLTRYLGNLNRTLGPATEAFKPLAELRRSFTA